jgi:hypothetical protein
MAKNNKINYPHSSFSQKICNPNTKKFFLANPNILTIFSERIMEKKEKNPYLDAPQCSKKLFIHLSIPSSKITKSSELHFWDLFCHSLIVIFLFAFNINNLLKVQINTNIKINSDSLLQYFKLAPWKSIFILIFLIIGYEFIYPIGQAVQIHYLKNPEGGVMKALIWWIEKFFSMFELHNLLMIFSGVTYLTTLLRLGALEILSNPLVIILMIIWWIMVLVTWFSRPYVKYGINIENLNLSDALKLSSKLAIHNFRITLKFFVLEGFLLIRFLINIVVILWIPALLLYLANAFDLIGKTSNSIILIVGIVLVFISCYINGIIEAFFTSYRFKIFSQITKKETDSTKN